MILILARKRVCTKYLGIYVEATACFLLSEKRWLIDLISRKQEIDSSRDKLVETGVHIPTLSYPLATAEGGIEGEFEYQRAIPGRVELLQFVSSNISFTIRPVGNDEWQLLCFPSSNQDVTELEKLICQLDGRSYETSTLSLDTLPHATTTSSSTTR